MKNSNEFNYIPPEKIVDSFDINHWLKVYINNLNLVFYSFRPKNYECYLVLTNNINFLKILILKLIKRFLISLFMNEIYLKFFVSYNFFKY